MSYKYIKINLKEFIDGKKKSTLKWYKYRIEKKQNHNPTG